MKIDLPWPDKRVFPNAKRGTHWRVYKDAEQEQRQTGRLLTQASIPFKERQKIAQSEGFIKLRVAFYPPDRRHRDDDGMIGAFKHLRDGIADALGVDDRRFRAHYFFEDAAKPGRVEVHLGGGRIGDNFSPQESLDALEENGSDQCGNTKPEPDQLRIGTAK